MAPSPQKIQLLSNFPTHKLFLPCHDSHSIDVVQAQRQAAKMPHCPLEMRASDADNAMGAEYFSKNRDKIRADLLKYGAIWLRGFELTKSVSGYRDMHAALGLEACLDPLHSSGLRKFASERDALYEEVSSLVSVLLLLLLLLLALALALALVMAMTFFEGAKKSVIQSVG